MAISLGLLAAVVVPLLAASVFGLWGPWARPGPSVLDCGDGDAITLKDVYARMLVLGAPGSGKTSSTLAQLMLGLHRHPERPSLVIVPAKGDDLEQHRRWHALSGSKQPFVVFGPGWHFNWPQFELDQTGGSVAALIPIVTGLQKLASGGREAGGDSVFWEQAAVRHAAMCARAVRLAQGELCMQDVHDFAHGVLGDRERQQTAAFLDSYPGVALVAAQAAPPSPERNLTLSYFANEWATLGERTQGSVHLNVMQMLGPLLLGPAGQTMASDQTDLSPRDLERGMTLFLDFPVLTGGLPNRLAAAAWVMCVNNYALRRPGGSRPVVVIQDEYPQTAIPGEDTRIAAVGRSHNLGGVLIAQNYPQLAAALGGGDKGRQEAQALLGCMGHIVAHANHCRETNQLLSETVGHELKTLFGGSTGNQSQPFDLLGYELGTTPSQASVNYSQQMLPLVRPNEFLGLLAGGPPHWAAEAIVVRANRAFRDGRSFKRVLLTQVL